MDLPQFVVSGDPMQLGAVGAETEGAFYDSGLIKGLRAYVLTESFRQAEDSTFLRILNRARLGKARDSDVQWLRAHFCPKVAAAAPRQIHAQGEKQQNYLEEQHRRLLRRLARERQGPRGRSNGRPQ